MNKNKFLFFYNKLLLALLLVVVNLCYHPSFHVARADAGDVEEKSSLTKYVFFITGLLILPNIRICEWLRNDYFKKSIIFISFLLLVSFWVTIFSPSSKIISDCRYLMIPLLFFILGFQIKLSEKEVMYYSLLYSIFIFITGFSQVMTNIGAFVIMEQYMVSAKNNVACMIAIGIVLSFYWSISNINKLYRIVFGSLVVVLYVIIFTIRGRAGTLASVISCLILTFHYILKNNVNTTKVFIRIILCLLLLIVMLAYLGKLTMIGEFIYDSLFMSYSGDITSGRGERNMDSLNLIFDNLFFGRIGKDINVEWVHNYVLRIFSDYGIIVGGLLSIPYFFLLGKIYKNIKCSTQITLPLLGNIILLIPFVMSMFEPTYPYSPGSVVLFPFFLYGVSYQSRKKYAHS